MPVFSQTVGEGLPADLRLDRYAAEYLKILSRSQIKSRKLKVMLEGKELKLSLPMKKIKAGGTLEFSWLDPLPTDLLPEDIPLEILYEDDRVIVINKEAGMVVHPGAGNPRGTLANALLFRRNITVRDQRPGIVHRLDKDTSGVIIAAWDDEALAFLADQFKNRRVKKHYAAIVRGVPKEKSGVMENFICRDSRDRKRFTVSAFPNRGKHAVTLYKVIRSYGSHSLVLLRPKTGRTHQLRVHLRHLGHPILGDPIYGVKDPLFPHAALMLHAKSLSILLPGKTEKSIFKTPLPSRFYSVITELMP
ncbi:ribosomal large subunit pseudouridine synthase D [Spirochaetia bacterium]|nr:ribosomal large subunit pseudouridine synthase D [Spirochaetia bacterium]